MKKTLTRIAATATMAFALAMPVYADKPANCYDCCKPTPVRTAVSGIGRFFADLNAKVWENQLVRMHERTERRLNRQERTILNAQYRIMDQRYHHDCIQHYHQCQPNNATVSMPIPFGYEAIPQRMFPPKETVLEPVYQQSTLAPSQETLGPEIILPSK